MKDKNQVFVVSLAITIIMAIWAVAFNANFTVVSNAAYSFLTNNFGWLYSGEYLSLWRIFQARFPELRLARKPLQILPYGPATCTGDFIRGQTIASLDWALPISSSARENRVLSVPYLNP